MNPTPYLVFEGTCREALETYAQVMGGEVEMMMTADQMPEGAPPEGKENWILHGAVQFDEGLLMASDNIFGEAWPMAGCSVHMAFPSVERGREVFAVMAEGGEVQMDYQATFWTPGFGTLRDRFGVNWMISTSQPFP